MTTPAYRRIVEDVQRAVAAGELQPGERLPSTRDLARAWGVAPATAARALTELTRAGTTVTQDRTGTVVAPARRATPRRPLDRDTVVAAAVTVADDEGLDAVSMRAVAARLGAAPMALYRHVPTKEDLLLLMADRVYGEDEFPDPPAAWRARLELVARTQWALYRRHPWLPHLGPLSRPLPLPNLMRHGELVLEALDDVGLRPARVLDLQILLFAHGQGLAANLEREQRLAGETGVTDQQWEDQQVPVLRAAAERGGHVHLARLIDRLATGYDFDLDALFETGLAALLDGFAVVVHREGRRRGRRVSA